ncbi:hypothetical protein [Flavobacterium sp. 102]|uniref:ATP-binding protein n=1 Tax=Flavobacterium sp. 102 TaxID=2135623 RepID=UPI000EB5795D|nr:hypothetical protein [Flavobacterium sp. 102]RKS00584.1 hypothetical protein C8C84_0203 [Flavobacterium sp. 102]
MIREKVHFPILFLLLLAFTGSCIDSPVRNTEKYYTAKDEAEAFYARAQLDSAYLYYNQAKEASRDKTGDEYGYVLLQMATVQQYIGDFSGAEETITEGLANYSGATYQPYFYQLLAIIYDKQKKYADALPYYEKAFATFKDETAKAITKNNIGLNYLERKQYHKALEVLKPQLKDPFLQNKKNEIARVLDNLGYAQFKLNSPDANDNLMKALQLRDSLQDYNGLMASNIHLSEYFQNDKSKSKKYAADALLAAKKRNSPDDKLQALRWLAESSDFAKANNYAIDYIKLNDSLNLARTLAKNQFAKIKYDATTALKDVEIQKGQKQLYFILFISAIILSTLLYFLIRSRNKNRLKFISYETETRLAKKIHDELANDVFQTMTYAETQNLQDSDKREFLLESLDNIYTRTRNISRQNSEIPTDEKYNTALLDLLNSFNSEKVNVIVNNFQNVDWTSIKKESKITLYRVLQELMVNMKKHSQSSLVVIGFTSSEKMIEIKYSDNGLGTEHLSISKKGLQNVENRIHDIKGTIIFEPETTKGFRVTIAIPK